MLHHQPRLARLQHHVVDGDGVFMRELGRDPALVHDLVADRVRLGLGESDGGQDLLDGDIPIQ